MLASRLVHKLRNDLYRVSGARGVSVNSTHSVAYYSAQNAASKEEGQSLCCCHA